MARALVGRWLSPDPAGLAAVDLTNPQSLNRYAYALNNPTTLTDPTGLASNNPGDPCSDIGFSDSNAGCQHPGCYLDGGWFPASPDCFGAGWPQPPYGGGGGGGGSVGGNSQNTGAPVRPLPAGGLPPSPCTINGDPVSCPQSPLWALILAAPPPFLIAITSTAQVPRNPGSGVLGAVGGFLGGIASTTYSSAVSPNGCINQFFWSTLSNMNPLTLSAGSAVGPGASIVSAVKFNSALAYAASRPNYLGGTGLLYPPKSTVFRGLVNSAQGMLEAVPMIQLDAAMFQAVLSEYASARGGECQ